MIKKTLNADFPKLPFLTGFIAILVGAGMTMLVQSSSVFTSALTPLVGMGMIRIERVYPITLGSNIGTTGTGLLAAMAASGDKLPLALQIGLCHLFFNISGILLFYPIPFMRIPIRLAKMMGNTTARYRWFAILYLIVMFFILPGSVFALSMLGMTPMLIVLGIVLLFIFVIILINIVQRKKPEALPSILRNWDFLPECLHSLNPMDRAICKAYNVIKSTFSCCCKSKKTYVTTATDMEQALPKTIEMVLLEPLNAGKTVNLKTDANSNCDSGVSSYASSATQSLTNSRYPSFKNLKSAKL